MQIVTKPIVALFPMTTVVALAAFSHAARSAKLPTKVVVSPVPDVTIKNSANSITCSRSVNGRRSRDRSAQGVKAGLRPECARHGA
jgi:hypothetical protein